MCSVVNDDGAISAVFDENNIAVFYRRSPGSFGRRTTLGFLVALPLRSERCDNGYDIVGVGGVAVGRR